MITRATSVTTLSAFFRDTYKPLRLLGRPRSTTEDFACCLGVYERLCGEPLESVALFDVVRFMEALAETRSPSTVNKYRRYLLAILRFARRQNLLAADWLDDVPKMPVVRDEPEAYMLNDIEALLVASRNATGSICDIPACCWWPALLLTIYDTGSRISAAMSIRLADVDIARRSIRVMGTSQKNRRGVVVAVSDQTTAAIAAIPTDVYLLFDWPYDRNCRQWQTLTRHFRLIIDAAGLPQPKDPFHQLRRTCASYCEAGGVSAQQQMGHASSTTTRAYLEPRIVRVPQAADVLPRPALPNIDPQMQLF